MNDLNKRAISEVIEVLHHTDNKILIKIPQNFIKFLYENSDNNYIPNIDFYSQNWEDSLQEDAKAILALIYRDYIVSKDERNKLMEIEENDRIRKEKELEEKYNIDNIFNKRKDEKNVSNQTTEECDIKPNVQLVEVKQISWYKKIINKILNFFRRNS